jgi:hypothetical protein
LVLTSELLLVAVTETSCSLPLRIRRCSGSGGVRSRSLLSRGTFALDSACSAEALLCVAR